MDLVRRLAGVVVDGDGVWLAIDESGGLSAVYSATATRAGDAAWDEIWASLDDKLGRPSLGSTMVARFVTPSPEAPTTETEIHIVNVTGFDPQGAQIKMAHIQRQGIGRYVAEAPIADPAALIALHQIRFESLQGELAPMSVRVSEDVDLLADAPRYLGTFSAFWQSTDRVGDGPQGVSMEEALAWARGYSGEITLRIGQDEYSPPRHLTRWEDETFPEWSGAAPQPRPCD